ncbi:MAG: hypothetical protein FJ202_08155 [Gemmatimonadetes bacterium]|nr:hypothetical protein [Gemmatimonadota bacterium]
MTNRRNGNPDANRGRKGLTLVEVVIAISMLTLVTLGLANFIRTFQRSTSDTSMMALASDLAMARIETVKGVRVYANILTTYGNTTETFATVPYKGFTRTTKSVRCSGCPTATNDYITVTVSVTGNNLPKAVTKTTAIAAF